MNCAEWEERVALQAGNDLAEAESAAVNEHLAACSECRAFCESLRHSLEALAAVHQEPIAEAHFAAVRARVMTQVAGRQRRRVLAWIGGLAAAATTVLVALLLRPAAVLPLPPVAVRIPPPPPAPVLRAVEPRPHPRVYRAARMKPPAPVPEDDQPLVVKLYTNDPNVVIYWIADRRGE
jgi:anti-sigma factor RsiW